MIQLGSLKSEIGHPLPSQSLQLVRILGRRCILYDF